jgi:hypothetical protein
MKIAIATACAALALSFAGAAAAEGRISATLETPQAAQSKFIAAQAVWNCAGSGCVAAIAPENDEGVDGCQQLARHVGRVSAYVSETRSLDAKALARCNTAARAPANIGTASR